MTPEHYLALVRWWEAEAYRLKGELLRQLPSPDVSQAEAACRRALEEARRYFPDSSGKPTLTLQGAGHLTRAGPAACRKTLQGPCPVRLAAGQPLERLVENFQGSVPKEAIQEALRLAASLLKREAPLTA